MSLDADILGHSNGARFHRADLHVHSYGPSGSYDVQDATMTPEAIVDMAIKENLAVIAITDHNAVGNVRAAVKYAQGKHVLVVPGVELSTPQGHLLVYCSTPAQLERFYGRLKISLDKKSCHDTIPQCLTYAEEFDGFGICAHIDQPSGIELSHPKFDVFKQEILNCPNLLSLEITNPDSATWFTHADEHPDRKHCSAIRRNTLGHEAEVSLAKVMGSDSHTLAAVGRNAANQKRLTRVKLDSLTFDALRIALLDCTARVRLEDLIPASIPHFVGMKLEGGFLKDQVIHFSRNLTCIIGGRGAGKSTLLESLRVASGNTTENTIVDSEVWPDCISLIYEDEVGQRHTLTRTKLAEVTNDDPNGPMFVNIESYGQGQTASTIHRCDQDLAILLTFLDGFLDLSAMMERDEELREELLANQTEIERLHQEVIRIPEIEKAKAVADGQLTVLRQQKAAQVVEMEQKLATERVFRNNLRANLTTLLTSINEGLRSDGIKDLIDSMDGAMLAVGKQEFEAVKTLVSGLADQVDKLADELKVNVSQTTDQITTELAVWITKEKEIRESIENIRRDLEKQNIKLDMAFIRKVTKDATDYAAKLFAVKKIVPKKDAAYKRRNALMKERRELKSKIFTTRVAFATLMNRNLATCVVDYSVNIKFLEGVLSKELEEIVKNAMNWRTSQVPKAALIAAKFSPLALLDVVDAKNPGPLIAILDENKNKVFTVKEATEIIEKLGQWEPYVAIQRCQFEDRPDIKVSRSIDLPNGKKAHRVHNFDKLSLGQQQSILLTILLFSRSTVPLVIDQPEDNLDSEFIYTTLVRSFRAIKEHRQVIIVTHNANIAVLGDAELIIPLRGASEVSVIRDRGSIDTDKTKDIVCTILEGSRKAFIRRYELYGF